MNAAIPKVPPPTTVKDDSTSGSSNVPSGFILKLYQMVNGAPNEVITWTPAGDAFIIGSDLNRLESETLPQYFRHNRFQSLVRQLNFYSFRKINRERNVWIYKHNLFHRDRPEDLYQVRRRTCPGVDGRKQRFSRLSAQKLSKNSDANGASSSNTSDAENAENDSSSEEEDSFEQQGHQQGAFFSAKRSQSGQMGSSKKPRILPQPEPEFEVDTSIVSNPTPSPTSVKTLIFEPEESGDDASTFGKNDRTEQLQQSLVVSEVATKLEEYVRKAMKKKGISRTRKGGSGIVTPPFGSSFTMTSRDLVTYDDEFKQEGKRSDIIPDTEDNASEGGSNALGSLNNFEFDKDMLVAPVLDLEIVKHITSEIIRRSNDFNGEVMRACANVVAFFMCTAPKEDPEQCSSKVLQLLDTSKQLEAEFFFYRAALHPTLFLESSNRHGFTSAQSNALRNTLTRGAGRLESLREFKIFAVNLIYKLISKSGSFAHVESFSGSDNAILVHTAEVWSKSVGIGVC
mmetsp:Transcript_18919/g.52831  ORF Transcript_18919/g.52831 Transcript_18919/m.52831 type:complete len:513 (-) Transcript_18919:564-2102(-)|eukprot:CAMPEP_0172379644 /NCGR_PEP_ID=MMETSP1060-20121228/70034_1 /TAXON_ID=37318 /ORGANISM="Pseudo-nitzschia pungens, Strain cf. cingulata" /LENGTH=512 /DNA_ID=CAMNT_0013107389 /DNA_START=1311 /DNA_END=2849 /DNA_ORIENTATION=+